MIYLVGGAARCGKTTLIQSVRKDFDGQIISSDPIRVAIKSITTPDSHPNLFDKTIDPVAEDDPSEKRIKQLRKRDDAVWSFMKEFFEMTAFSNDDVLSEGCYWPSMLSELSVECRAVFLVDTSEGQAERLIHIRDTAKYNNWMRDRKYTDEKMKQWAQFNIERSKEIIRECGQYNYPFFDIADSNMNAVQHDASEYLFGRVKR